MGDLDGGAVGIGAGWPDRNVAQHSQTVSSSSLMEPWTGSILHTNKNTTSSSCLLVCAQLFIFLSGCKSWNPASHDML